MQISNFKKVMAATTLLWHCPSLAGKNIYYGFNLGFNQDVIHYDINEYDYVNFGSNNPELGFLAGVNLNITPQYALDLELDHYVNSNKASFINSMKSN